MLQTTVRSSTQEVEPILDTLDPDVITDQDLSDAQVVELFAFLEALTDPAGADLTGLIPESVPSGLPVDQ